MENEQQNALLKGLMQQFNHNNIFDVDTTNFKWVDLKTLYNTDPEKGYQVLGLFTNNSGKFGNLFLGRYCIMILSLPT